MYCGVLMEWVGVGVCVYGIFGGVLVDRVGVGVTVYSVLRCFGGFGWCVDSCGVGCAWGGGVLEEKTELGRFCSPLLN